MTVTEICEKAKITRQWLNQLVDRGGVPGCSRKKNGRLEIVNHPGLERWIKVTAAMQKRKRGRRLSLQALATRFAAIQNVEKKQGKFIPAPDRSVYTVNSLARKLGVNVSTVRRRILEIPDAFYDGRKYLIRDTQVLRKWIDDEITIRLQERERQRLKRLSRPRTPKAPVFATGAAINKAVVDVKRLLRDAPLKSWGNAELSALRDDLEHMIRLAHDIDKELSEKRTFQKATLAAIA